MEISDAILKSKEENAENCRRFWHKRNVKTEDILPHENKAFIELVNLAEQKFKFIDDL